MYYARDCSCYGLPQCTAHHTKFKKLLELGKSLGHSYFNELEVCKNSSYSMYTSYHMIEEFLAVLCDL